MSATDDLAAARAARTRILAGAIQSYQTVLGGQTVYLDLAKLSDLIATLEGQAALEGLSGCGPVGVQEIALGRVF